MSVIVSPASVSDRASLTALWLEVFSEDTKEDVEHFLELFPIEKHAMIVREDGKIVSMLFLLDTHLAAHGERLSLGYIYAGATAPAHRGKGHYRRLIGYALEVARKRDMAAVFLRPATDPLFQSYRRMGFVIPMTVQDCCLCQKGTVALKRANHLSQYVSARRSILSKYQTAFVDWDERFFSFALSWCECGIGEDGTCVLLSDNTAWEWLSMSADDVSKVIFEGDAVDVHTARMVGTARTVGLLYPLKSDVCWENTPMYFGYGLE